MLHIPQDKSKKRANPPHTRESQSWQYGDKAPLKPHMSRGGEGGGESSGFTLTGALEKDE